jgi:sugar phosphate permease
MSSLRGVPIRFRILGVLFVLSIINYLLRNNLSIALPSIRQEFGFTSTGWVGSSAASISRTPCFSFPAASMARFTDRVAPWR